MQSSALQACTPGTCASISDARHKSLSQCSHRQLALRHQAGAHIRDRFVGVAATDAHETAVELPTIGTKHQSAAGDAAPLAEPEAEAEGDYCMPPDISVDNSAHEDFSLLTIKVKAYPGMFRVISWVLNGLELDVVNAKLTTDESGYAENTFWLTDTLGRKVSDTQLESVAERLGDYVQYCTPDDSVKHATRFSHGPITVDNSLDDKYTVITILASTPPKERHTRNALLEIASCINAVGVRISSAVIKSCSDSGVPIDEGEFNKVDRSNGARLYRIWGTNRSGGKLDHARATALIFTLSLLLGNTVKTGSHQVPRYELD